MEDTFCNKCGECCKHIKADFENKKLFFDGIQELEDSFKDMLIETSKEGNISVCRCKYLQNNLCTNNEKPDICTRYPSSPFAFIPENCGYTGKVFSELEKIKQKIRKFKEEIIDYGSIINSNGNKNESRHAEWIIKSHEKFIDKYKEYGSQDW